LGKGYATIPSTINNQLPAQLHYDHHFCKIQSINKEQRHIDDLLANSLVNFIIFYIINKISSACFFFLHS
jgi:hypothetical protein